MEFMVTGKKTRRVEYEIETTETISITKKEVMRITDCPAKEDGDSTAWYEYVEEAIQHPDCKYKVLSSEEEPTILHDAEWFQDCDVEWI